MHARTHARTRIHTFLFPFPALFCCFYLEADWRLDVYANLALLFFKGDRKQNSITGRIDRNGLAGEGGGGTHNSFSVYFVKTGRLKVAKRESCHFMSGSLCL